MIGIILLCACSNTTQNTENRADERSIVKSVELSTATLQFTEDWYYENLSQSNSNADSMLVYFDNTKPEKNYDFCFVAVLNDIVKNQITNAQARYTLQFETEAFLKTAYAGYQDLKTEFITKDTHPMYHCTFYVPNQKTSYDSYAFMASKTNVIILIKYHHDNSDKSSTEYDDVYKEFVDNVQIQDPGLIDIHKPVKSSSNDGCDYSAGSSWESYDINHDCKIDDLEFQDALGVYLIENAQYYYDYSPSNNGGEPYKKGSDWEKYDANHDGKINDDEFADALDAALDKYMK